MKLKFLAVATCMIALFSVDLAYGYHPLSPYAYCMGNPIKFVDPNGEDVWEIDAYGEVISQYEDETQDAFYIVRQVDGKWQRIEEQSISFEYGTVTALRRPEVTFKNKGKVFSATLTLFEIQGDDNASLLFEFMGNPDVTNVEWADVKIGTENSGRNIVGNTENGKDYNAVGPYLLQMNYTIREDNHSHVYRNKASNNDRLYAKKVNTKFPNARLNTYFKGLYTPYGKSGVLGQPYIRPIIIKL